MFQSIRADLEGFNRAVDFAGVRPPVLFLRGSHDWVRDEDVRFYASQCANAQIVTIENAGHLAHIDKPRETIAATHKFMRLVDA